MRFILLFLTLLTLVFGENIEKYSVDVNIEPSGRVRVVELIKYNFGDAKKHGIYRDIPLTIKYKNRVINLHFNNFEVLQNGSSVNYETTTFYSKENGKNIKIRVGSKDSYVSGVQLYTISYYIDKIVLPYSEDKDIISLNAIGTLWGVPINEAVVTYYLPDTLNRANTTIKTYTGKYGSIESRAKISWLNNHTFRVYVKDLPPYNGVTIDLIFNRGALGQSGLENIKVSPVNRLLDYLYLILFLPITLYLRNLYKKYAGFVDKRAIAVMYEPPKDITVLQAGLILDAKADNKDYAAAILELAVKGYIKIEQDDDKIVLIATDKNRNNLEEDLKMLLDGLLPNAKSKFYLEENNISQAQNMQMLFNTINEKLYDISVQKGYFKERPYNSKKEFLKKAILAILPFGVYLAYYLYTSFGIDGVIMTIFPLVFTTLGINVMMQGGVFSVIFGLVFAAVGSAPLISSIDKFNGISNIVFGPIGFMIALIAAVIYLSKRVSKITQKGAYIKTHLLGLQEFIKRVKTDEIKYRLQQDPLYLEKLLPYAVLFKESKHWIELFNQLNITTPIWFDGNIESLGNFDNNFQNAANFNDSTPSSGFGGGGGSSGGGGGGGGGGSW